MGFDFDALVFYGFVVDDVQSESELWQGGADVIPGEDFVARFRRRLAAFEDPPDLALHEVGIEQRGDEGLPRGSVYVYVRESVTMGSMGQARALDLEVSTVWVQKVQQFCTVMEIPWQEPTWHWFATASG